MQQGKYATIHFVLLDLLQEVSDVHTGWTHVSDGLEITLHLIDRAYVIQYIVYYTTLHYVTFHIKSYIITY